MRTETEIRDMFHGLNGLAEGAIKLGTRMEYERLAIINAQIDIIRWVLYDDL